MDIILILGWIFAALLFVTSFFWLATVVMATEVYISVFGISKTAFRMMVGYIWDSLLEYPYAVKEGYFMVLHPEIANETQKDTEEKLRKLLEDSEKK